MSKVKITGNASGTGVLTITSPNTDTDRTITLPDSTGTVLMSDGDGSNLTNLPAGGVDGIVSTANATAITIDSSENVGIGVVPEAWQSTRTALQIGDSTAVWGDVYKNTWFTNNVYRNSSNTESYINASYASEITMTNGGIMDFKVAPSGTADAAISWTTSLQLTNDGRGLSRFTAKAWVNFNGTGTVAIRDSHNVSSITDIATGRYTVNYTNNVGAGNSVSLTLSYVDNSGKGSIAYAQNGEVQTATCKFYTAHHDYTAMDTDTVTCVTFGGG